MDSNCIQTNTSSIQADTALGQTDSTSIETNNSSGEIAFEGFPYNSNFLELSNGLDIHYLEEGSGDPIILLHGVPTSSYLWRDIVPELAERGRVIVPDLINFGLSDKTDEPLNFLEHGELIEEFIESLDLENITLVGHDWGGPIGLTYAVDHPENIEAIAYFESPVVPLPDVDALKSLGDGFFETFIDPANSETNIVDNNLFIEGYLFNPEFGGVAETPTEVEQAVYREPFLNPEDRQQLLTFPLELPVLDTTGHPVYDPDGVGGNPPEPVPNIDEFINFANYLAVTDTPQLLILGNPGSAPRELILPLASQIPGVEIQEIGDENNPAFHFLQEDLPEELSTVLGEWIDSINETFEPEPTSETTLQITIENLAPDNGVGFAALWFGLHDGSFDTFNPGEPASESLEFLFEDGLVGLEEVVLPGILEEIIAAGLDTNQLPLSVQQAIALGLDLPTLPPPPGTLAGDFLTSPAGANGGTQGMVVTSTRTNPELFDILDDPSAFPQEVLDSVDNPFFFIQASGETETFTVTLDGTPEENRYFSFASMLFPTNDGFIGNDDPQAIEIFDESGNFVGADFIVTGEETWDGGTEVNDESPESLLYTFEAFGNGVDENGTVQPFPGFLPPGEGGVLDFEFNGNLVAANADFTVPDYPIARITVTAVDEPEEESQEDFEQNFGTVDNDILEVIGGNELIFAGSGDDLIDASASQGNNRIYAGGGDDILILGRGDVLAGGDGEDRFFNQVGGDNRVSGGAGVDQFWIATAELPESAVIIGDFELDIDVIGVAGIGASSTADLDFSQDGNNAIISFNGTDLAVFQGIDANNIENSGTLVFG